MRRLPLDPNTQPTYNTHIMSTLALTQQVASRTGAITVTISIFENGLAVESRGLLRTETVHLAFDEISNVEQLAEKFVFHEVGVFMAVVEMLGRIHANLAAYEALV